MTNFKSLSLNVKITIYSLLVISVLGSCFFLLLASQLADGVLEANSEVVRNIIFIAISITLVQCLFLYLVINAVVTTPITDASDLLKIISKGDLSTPLFVDKGDEISRLYSSFSVMQDSLTEVISGIRSGAIEVSIAAEQVSQGNANLSQRTQEEASSLEQIAASMEEMTGTVNQNSENAQHANQLAKSAQDEAQHGDEVVAQVVYAMSEINGASKKIADIIGVIDEIAFQTNLLALNAAVEAARAGEQGRGFAVVASEVRNLAGRSATAAKEIKTLIQDSVAKVEDGTKLVDESGQALDKIMGSVKKVGDIIGEIAAASMEQTDGIKQVNRALIQMDEATQQNASLVEEAAAASEAMEAQAEELTSLVSYFKLRGGEGADKTVDIVRVQDDPQSKPQINTRENMQTAVVEQPKASLPPGKNVDDSKWQEF